MKHVLEAAREAPLGEMTKQVIVAGRERRQKTPSQANNFLKLMRGLFAWAVEAELVKSNPADGVKAVKTKTIGFRAWEEDDVDKFEQQWPLGTRERLALASRPAVHRAQARRRGPARPPAYQERQDQRRH